MNALYHWLVPLVHVATSLHRKHKVQYYINILVFCLLKFIGKKSNFQVVLSALTVVNQHKKFFQSDCL